MFIEHYWIYKYIILSYTNQSHTLASVTHEEFEIIDCHTSCIDKFNWQVELSSVSPAKLN